MTTPTTATPRTTKRRRFGLRRLALWALCLLIGAGIAGEIGARYILGLGDPPLYMLDPEVEYLLVPNQKCRRFGHDYVVNSHSMRSGEFAGEKRKGEYRVMVIGDSIVNGGARVDQAELATSLIHNAPVQQSHLVVGNISAGSWGPPNQLAYAKKFGLFEADLVIIVANSDDDDDVPGLEYLGSAWPRTKPVFALQELVQTYGWRYICKMRGVPAEPRVPARAATHEQDMELCRRSFTELIELTGGKGAKVAVVQYLKKSELNSKPQAGYEVVGAWAKSVGAPTYSTGAAFKRALADPAGSDPFLANDDVHASAAGQKILAEVLRRVVDDALRPAPSTPTAP